MAKEIYLIRHAKSSWKHAGELADVNRPLAKRGVRDAIRMSEKLASKQVSFDRIYSSDGIRALHTAVMFARNMELNSERISVLSELYLPSSGDILGVIRNAQESEGVIAIFAHDPGISHFTFKTDAKLHHVVTTGIVHYKLDAESWEDASMANLRFQSYDFPKNNLS